MKIINSIWFTEYMSAKPIGIVIIEDEITGERKAYIGVGDGYAEEADITKIAENGARFHAHTVFHIAKNLSMTEKQWADKQSNP